MVEERRGGTVWNAMSYDPETDTVFLGSGNGSPWNRKIRSQGRGDNLFLASIVALDGKTGAYKWHYQVNPGESWDYNANMDMEFADLSIGGKPRKVLMTAPKNGFLYVIDRLTGEFISAEPFVKVTWAKGIDQKTGRPIETPNSRYESGPFLLAPSPVGAHSWLPMAFSRMTGLVYIPAMEQDAIYSDKGFELKDWRRPPGFSFNGAVGVEMGNDALSAALIAWNPVTQKEAWRIPMPSIISGGVVATAGNLVFQGSIDGHFNAYDASSGKPLWSFDAKAPVMAPPISYQVDGRQYVTVMSGSGTSLVLLGAYLQKYGISYRDQKRRVLTFALGGGAAAARCAALSLRRGNGSGLSSRSGGGTARRKRLRRDLLDVPWQGRQCRGRRPGSACIGGDHVRRGIRGDRCRWDARCPWHAALRGYVQRDARRHPPIPAQSRRQRASRGSARDGAGRWLRWSTARAYRRRTRRLRITR
jgi:outer membrane protein assembly factor BamB